LLPGWAATSIRLESLVIAHDESYSKRAATYQDCDLKPHWDIMTHESDLNMSVKNSREGLVGDPKGFYFAGSNSVFDFFDFQRPIRI